MLLTCVRELAKPDVTDVVAMRLLVINPELVTTTLEYTVLGDKDDVKFRVQFRPVNPDTQAHV